jgi:hypothetical protein
VSPWSGRSAAVLLAAVLLPLGATAGCAADSGLHDAGPARPVSSWPSPVLLWPAVEPARSPAAQASPSVAADPLPGLTAAGDDIRVLDPRAILGADPALRGDERAALNGCTGCQVLTPEYRDLTGDGRPELIVAVLTAAQHGYLHVYRLREHRVLPALDLSVPDGFTAETQGTDLVVDEPGSATRTTTRYSWNAEREWFNRQITVSCQAGAAADCLPQAPSATPSAPTFKRPSTLPWPVPSAPAVRPSAPGGSR